MPCFVVGGMEQQVKGEDREKPTRVLLEAFPPLGIKDIWSKGANTVHKFGVDGKIMSFT